MASKGKSAIVKVLVFEFLMNLQKKKLAVPNNGHLEKKSVCGGRGSADHTSKNSADEFLIFCLTDGEATSKAQQSLVITVLTDESIFTDAVHHKL